MYDLLVGNIDSIFEEPTKSSRDDFFSQENPAEQSTFADWENPKLSGGQIDASTSWKNELSGQIGASTSMRLSRSEDGTNLSIASSQIGCFGKFPSYTSGIRTHQLQHVPASYYQSYQTGLPVESKRLDSGLPSIESKKPDNNNDKMISTSSMPTILCGVCNLDINEQSVAQWCRNILLDLGGQWRRNLLLDLGSQSNVHNDTIQSAAPGKEPDPAEWQSIVGGLPVAADPTPVDDSLHQKDILDVCSCSSTSANNNNDDEEDENEEFERKQFEQKLQMKMKIKEKQQQKKKKKKQKKKERLSKCESMSSSTGSAASTLNDVVQSGCERQHNLSIAADETFLDPVHIFLRRDCIEVFEKSEEDVVAQGKGSLKKLGRVGLRCRYCKHLPKKELVSQSVCFPSKRSTIFESVRNMTRRHLNECPCIPTNVLAEFKRMEGLTPTISQRYIKAYYTEAASELGLVDTPDGILFDVSPSMSSTPSPMLQSLINAAQDPKHASSFWNAYSSANDKKGSSEMMKFGDLASAGTNNVIMTAQLESTPLVKPEDFPHVSDHEFILYHQFIPCSCAPPESLLVDDAQGSGPGFGLCCKHCSFDAHDGVHQKKKERGEFFPPDLKTFGHSFYVKKLLSHIMTCDRVPQEIRDSLDEIKRLASEQGATAKRGSRLRFIQKVWGRLEELAGCN